MRKLQRFKDLVGIVELLMAIAKWEPRRIGAYDDSLEPKTTPSMMCLWQKAVRPEPR